MKIKKIINYFLIILVLAISIIFYFSFDLEDILWNRYERVNISNEQIKDNTTIDYTGQKAGEGII